jgi:lambda family phage tail tape measure protein
MSNDTNFVVNADTNPAIAALQKLNSKIEETQTKFKENLEKMSNAALALGASLIATGYEVAAFADEVTDLSKAHQIAVGEILAMGEALAQNGGHADSAGRILQKFNNSVEEANGGNLKLVSTFNRLGVSIDDLGKLSNSALKDKLLDSLAKIKDPLERNALAFQIFGKAITGVDIAKFAEDQRKNRDELEKYAPALNTAGDAWDHLHEIAVKTKIAFAVVFEPVFAAINAFNPTVDSLTTKFKLMAAALSVLTGAVILRGLLAIRTALVGIAVAAAANPITAVIALGAALATYLGLGYMVEESQKKITEATKETGAEVEQNVRNQTGLNDAVRKELQSLTQVREQLEKGFQTALARYDLELKSFSLSEEQKKVAQDRAAIEQEAQNALFSLKQKFDAMDTDTQKRNLAAYEQEQIAIQNTAEAQKKASEARLRQITDYSNTLKTFQGIAQTSADFEQKIFEAQAKQKIDTSGYREKIDYETKLAQVTQIRSGLTGNLSKLSETEKRGAIGAIDEATNSVDLLAKGYGDIGQAIRQNIQLSVQNGKISQESANSLLVGFDKNFGAISTGAEALAKQQKELTEQSRTFSAGWNKAFTEYADAASNSAASAKRIFDKFTQGMEDTLVNFFKTGKFEWGNFLNSMAEELLRSQIRQLFASMLPTFGPGGAGGGGATGGASGIGSLFGSIGKMLGFADGGIIPTNAPVIVGERGPEIISNAKGLSVTPNNAIATNVTYNISAVDALSFKQMIARDPSFLYAVTMQGAKTIPGRG